MSRQYVQDIFRQLEGKTLRYEIVGIDIQRSHIFVSFVATGDEAILMLHFPSIDVEIHRVVKKWHRNIVELS